MRTFSEEREVHMNGLWGFAVHDSHKPSVIFAPCEGSNFADFRYRQHNSLVPGAGNALDQINTGVFHDALGIGSEGQQRRGQNSRAGNLMRPGGFFAAVAEEHRSEISRAGQPKSEGKRGGMLRPRGIGFLLKPEHSLASPFVWPGARPAPSWVGPR